LKRYTDAPYEIAEESAKAKTLNIINRLQMRSFSFVEELDYFGRGGKISLH
jgi:hypothetical protein